ncbi:MAG: gliding motility protein GldC [Bacteroidetes bacterium]|nr:MAG: gliding motility protein GldC [Bacteroidota bacterium]PTM13496.1 MAG: gliding motility protein GldC [Bacteroidota bacterium]
MSKTVIQTSDINIKIGLNEEKLPVRIDWDAADNPAGGQVAKAMLLSLFDDESKETLKIDLWTNDMQVMEMDRFFFQTLRGLTDTYFRATQNAEMAADMQRFVHYFGEKTGIIEPTKK